jgi:hypothetical protein
MALTYGFYNSVDSDRVYDAVQVSSIFDGVIEDGVFSTIGDSLIVAEYSGMVVHVGTGRAWFNHTWTLNDAEASLTLDAAHATLPRIDVVALEINAETDTRANSLKIVKGTPASEPEPPELTNTSTIHQYPLAHILVGATVTEIVQNNITNKVGTDDCPFVAGPLTVVSVEELLIQWDAEWHIWFDFVVNELTEEQFGNLQDQINDHDHSEVLNTPVVTDGIAALAVTKAKLASDSVDDSKIEYRVPTLGKRQGASGTNWDDAEGGLSDYTLTNVKMEVGVKPVIIANGNSSNSGIVTFPVVFSYIPIVLSQGYDSGGADCNIIVTAISTSQATFKVTRPGTTGSLQVNIYWLAVGPE